MRSLAVLCAVVVTCASCKDVTTAPRAFAHTGAPVVAPPSATIQGGALVLRCSLGDTQGTQYGCNGGTWTLNLFVNADGKPDTPGLAGDYVVSGAEYHGPATDPYASLAIDAGDSWGNGMSGPIGYAAFSHTSDQLTLSVPLSCCQWTGGDVTYDLMVYGLSSGASVSAHYSGKVSPQPA